MKVHELVASFGRAGESANPMNAAREILESLRGQVEDIENTLAYIAGTGGNGTGVLSLAKNHATQSVFSGWPSYAAAQSRNMGDDPTVVGGRKNTLYRRENGKLRQVGETTLTRGAILPMPAETVHVAQCRSNVPAIGLHVYGGDIFAMPRHMWNPETLEEHALDWALYEKFAQAASRPRTRP